MAIERYGSKTDVVVKLVLVFFVCLLSFSVGTFVGKKFSDNQHRLAQFEPASAEREVASTDGKESTPKAGEALSDEDIAKLAEEFVNEDDGASANAQTNAPTATVAAAPTKVVERTVAEAKPATPAVAPAAPAVPAVKPLAIAEKIALGVDPKAPASANIGEAKVTLKADPEKKPIPMSLPSDVAASAIGKYTVQVASYPNETEATKMTENLKGQGFGAFYIKADITDKKTAATKTWYRVSVGLFQTQKEADAYKADLLSRSKVSSAIVQRVTK
jgi:hypothetical protein